MPAVVRRRLALRMDAELTISRRSLAQCEVLSLAGELDLARAPEVSETLDALAAPSRPVVVDLTDLDFIDSTGIHALAHSAPRRGVVELVCPPGNVRRVLEMARIDRVLRVFDSLDAALAEHGAPAGGAAVTGG